MRLCKLTLNNFRNYEAAEIVADTGVNLLVGDNAQGKTNLLEAIVFSGSGKSFRTQHPAELIRFGAPFGEITGEVFSGERAQTIHWSLVPGRTRRLTLNKVHQPNTEKLSGVLQTVLFCPEDLLVLKAGAGGRRHMADNVLCQLRPNYEAALSQYGKIIEQKNSILKGRFDTPALLDLLPEYNEKLCQAGALLISYRARFFQGLAREAEDFYRQVSGDKEKFHLTYKTVSTVDNPFADTEILAERLREHLSSHQRAELESGQCLTGPHKDDFDVTLSGISLKSYGSQGQVRTAAIVLKLAQRRLMEQQTGETPVLLLDDVLSELDDMRQDFVLNQIKSGQVFITCCDKKKFTTLGKTVVVENGRLSG